MNKNLLRRSLHNQNVNASNIFTTQGGVQTVNGMVFVNGAGEAFIDVNFPVKFTTIPAFTFGYSMKEGDGVQEGNIPTGTAHVAEWKTVEKLPNSVYYTGAVIRTVITGLFFQKMILNYTFDGLGVTNPS